MRIFQIKNIKNFETDLEKPRIYLVNIVSGNITRGGSDDNRNRRSNSNKITVEQLDAELEEYRLNGF